MKKKKNQLLKERQRNDQLFEQEMRKKESEGKEQINKMNDIHEQTMNDIFQLYKQYEFQNYQKQMINDMNHRKNIKEIEEIHKKNLNDINKQHFSRVREQ